MNAPKNVTRVRDVNAEVLSDLIIRAKGPKRSIRGFAEEIGVNASTLTRLVNMQNKAPSSNELIFKIAEYADSDSGVTLEMLMEAHGIEKNSKAASLEYFKHFEKRMRQVILDELISRDYTVKIAMDKSRVNRHFFDLILESNALGEQSKLAFEFKTYKTEKPITGIGNTKQWINRIMAMYYRRDLAIKDISRVTLVVEIKEIFEQVKKILSEYTIPDEISVVLVSNDQIADEYVVNKTIGEPKYIFREIY